MAQVESVQCSSVTRFKRGYKLQVIVGRGRGCVLGCDLLDARLYSSLVKLGRLKFKVPELQEVRFSQNCQARRYPVGLQMTPAF